MKKYFDDPVKQEMLKYLIELKKGYYENFIYCGKLKESHINRFIEKATGKPIEEVIKDDRS